ncbi:MAG: septum formation initiator family protein, partial [Caldilineae bacterium]
MSQSPNLQSPVSGTIVASTTRKRKKVNLPLAQFTAIVVLSISLFLIVDFGRRAATGYRIHREEKRLAAELEQLQQEHAALEERRAYVQSDAYVEEVARNELKWSRPGETVIVVLATPQAAPPTARPARSFLLPPPQV